MVSAKTQTSETFTEYFSKCEPMLRHALVATCGLETGREASADAFLYAWKHWDRVGSMEHPTAYLYRVGRSAARRYRRTPAAGDPPDPPSSPWIEPDLEPALHRLSERQRVAVLLRHSFGCTYRDIAGVMGISISSVQKHIERGLEKLRRSLEVA